MDRPGNGPPPTTSKVHLSEPLFDFSASQEPIPLHATEQHGTFSNEKPYNNHGDVPLSQRKPLEPIFHPELHRTKEVIRKPTWLSGAATGETIAHRGSLNSLALFGMLFANCIGGGYGFEDGISAAGPLITLIVCIILPWIWCFPTGLAVAELSTSVKSNSGVLMWTNAAFPPFISFLCILGTVFIIFIGNATYPNLTAEYFSNLIDLSGWQLMLVKIAVIGLCCFVNCVGVEVVGTSTVVLCFICIAPFAILTSVQLFGHGFNKAVLHVDLSDVNWSDFFSIISWNYANIENAGAVVEEVQNPQTTLPKSMAMLMFSSYAAYVVPMLAGVSAMGVGQDYSQWVAGHWPDVAEEICGPWLKYTMFVAAIFSGMGFTVTSICCTSRLLAGIGTMRIFPKKISRFIGYYHPRLGTPIVAIIINSFVTMTFSLTMDFTSVVALCQSLYCLRMLLIYGALIKLRIQYPNLARPYQLPCNTLLAALCLTPAAIFSVFAAVVSSMASFGISMAMIGFLVGGSAVSWLYCRFVAKNGFQGAIVQCWAEEEEEEELLKSTAVVGGGLEEDGLDHSSHDERAGALPIVYSPTAEVTWFAEKRRPPDEPNNLFGDDALLRRGGAEYHGVDGAVPGLRRRKKSGVEGDGDEDTSTEDSSTDDERYQ